MERLCFVRTKNTVSGEYLLLDNLVQLMTDLQAEPNRTADAMLLEGLLDDQSAREIEVNEVTTDGGYRGPGGEAACEKHDVELRATRMRGGRSAGAGYR